MGFVPLTQSCASPEPRRADWLLGPKEPGNTSKNAGISTLSSDFSAFHYRADHPRSGSGINSRAAESSFVCAVETLTSFMLQSCNPRGDAKVLIAISCFADHELSEISMINM